jgi:hypothetical protein
MNNWEMAFSFDVKYKGIDQKESPSSSMQEKDGLDFCFSSLYNSTTK